MPKSITMEMDEVLKLTKSAISKEEFLDAFKQVIQLIKDLKGDNAMALNNLIAKYNELSNQLKNGYNVDISDIKQKVMDYCMAEMSRITESHENRLLGMEEKMNGLVDEISPQIAIKASEIARSEVLPLIPTIEAIEADLPQLGGEIASALELLPDEEKLEIKAIKNLQEQLDELRKEISKKSGGTMFVGSGGNGAGRIVKSYDISSQLNGVLTTFSLPHFTRIISVHLSSFPNILRETTDYTSDGALNTITFTSEVPVDTSLATGQTCVIVFSE